LVQALILIHFLLSLTEQAKKKLATLEAVNKSMLYAFTLNEDDTKWALATHHAIKQSLQSTADGRFYDRMVETVLARDKNWVRWKVESCPSIVRDAVTTEQEIDARRGAKAHTRPRKIPPKPMGAMDWSFLVDHDGGGLEALKDPSRFSAPSLEDLLKGIDVDKLDLEMAMDDAETARYNNMIDNKSWRAVRHARVHNFNMLAKFEPGADLKKVFEQPKQPDPAEEAAATTDEANDENSGSKTEDQDEGGDAIEGKSNSPNQVLKQESHEEPVAANTGDPADPSTKPDEALPAVEDPEKMQTDSSVAAE